MSLAFHPLADIFPRWRAPSSTVWSPTSRRTGCARRSSCRINARLSTAVIGIARFSNSESPEKDRSADGKPINDDDEVRAYILSANIHRRHLTAKQKRELMAKLLAAQPEKSNDVIAKQTNADEGGRQ
jgi:hypothetical protein